LVPSDFTRRSEGADGICSGVPLSVSYVGKGFCM